MKSSDLDVEVILEDSKVFDKRPHPFLLNDVYIELHVHDCNSFKKIEEVATSSGFGAHIVNSITLYDPTGFFNSIKRKIDEIYFTTPFIRKRITNSLHIAKNYIKNAEGFLSESKPELVPGLIHRAVNSGIALALFNYKKSNPTQRRSLSKLENILNKPEEKKLYTQILDLLHLDKATYNTGLVTIIHGEKYHKILSNYIKSEKKQLWQKNKHWYNELTRRYIIEGAKILLKQEKYAASIFCTMMLANSSIIPNKILPIMEKKDQENTLFHLEKIFKFKKKQPLQMFSKSIQNAKLIINNIEMIES